MTPLLVALLAAAPQQPSPPGTAANVFATGTDQKAPLEVAPGIFVAFGFGNVFAVTTRAGHVVVDTGNPRPDGAARQRALLAGVAPGPARFVVLTHGHADHTGGVSAWQGPATEVVAQRAQVEFMHYQTRLAGFCALRNAAQFQSPIPAAGVAPGNFDGRVLATRLFDAGDAFELGGLRFELFHAPGETPDHLALWIPQLKAAFVGDKSYTSFPNVYTLRGTQPRPALDYVASLDKVLTLGPELLLPSHGQPLRGKQEVERELRRYRDAILYVHDATLRGMNEGKDVFTLMRTIKLPPELAIDESYGNVPWSVRGIYEGYAGWFDLDPATMYALPPAAAYPELVRLTGGPERIAARAGELLQAGELVLALRLTEAALAVEPGHRASREARLAALRELRRRCRNSNECGWLDAGIRATEKVAAAR